MKILDSNKVDTVVLHVTVSNFGTVKVIDRWHKQRGFDMIGYHYLITNVFPKAKDLKEMTPQLEYDGKVFAGRPIKYRGAHVRGYNYASIGIALIGAPVLVKGKKRLKSYGALFSSKQLYSACAVITDLMNKFPNINKIRGHTELDPKKSCPLINMDHFREIFNNINK